MSYLRRNELSRDAVKALAAGVSEFGDLVCPHCRAQIITPAYAMVEPGWGRCPRCRGAFSVDEYSAKCANLRAARVSAGVGGLPCSC
jgi:hypothetical protein